MPKFLFLVLLLLIGQYSYSQEDYSVAKINPLLLLNADAVIREHSRIITVEDIDEVIIQTTRVVTVLNKSGNDHVRAIEFYDDEYKIEEQEAIVYNKNGEEIKKFKKKDFTDRSQYDGTLFSGNRIRYLDYTPGEYPYTIEYHSEVEKKNSVFLPDWVPVEGYDISVESSSYQLLNPKNLSLRFAERNFEGSNIGVQNSETQLSYSVKDIPALKYESLSPSIKTFTPRVLVALDKFYLEGITGEATNWNEFGKWMHDQLILGNDELPVSTIKKIENLTKDAQSIEDKARLIYKYVQENTRYIAVEYGIGGWEPVSAREVDKLGYGDCKGLTNYTKALLKSQGVESFYSVIYGGSRRDIDPEFAKMQGNHVILNVPREDGTDIWLECTSQVDPFDYLGNFTDDRYVLRVKPTGGDLVKTRKYSETDNLQGIFSTIKLTEQGDFSASLIRSSHGIQYSDVFGIENRSEKDRKEYYREEWSHLANLNFEEMKFENNKKDIEFIERISFSGERIAAKAGNRLIFPLNFVQKGFLSLDRIENRKRSIKLLRGKTLEDDFQFILPKGYSIEALPETESVKTEFGEFTIEVSLGEVEEMTSIIVKRNLIIREGEWAPEKYKDFREFIAKANFLNNLKAVIVRSET